MKNSKKQKILFVLLLVFSLANGSALAQPASWKGHLLEVYPQIGESVIKVWTDSFAVVAYHEVDSQCIALIQIAEFMSNSPSETVYPQAYKMAITDSLDIKDICITGDTLFFCGTWDNKPAYGWYDLDSIKQSMTPDDIHFYYISGPITELTKLVVYNEEGYYHMVALGNDGYRNAIVESPHLFQDTNQIDVAIMNVAAPPQRDMLDDLDVLDNFLVITGRDTRFGPNCATMRLVPKSPNILMSSNINLQYRIPAENNTVQPPVLVTRAQMDPYFGVVCICHDNYTNQNFLRVYSVNSGLSCIPVVSGTQDIYYCADTLKDLTYTVNDQIIPLTSLAGNIMSIIPVQLFAPSPYSITVFQQSDTRLQTIDRIGGMACAMWGTGLSISLQKFNTSIATCMDMDTKLSQPATAIERLSVVDPPAKTVYPLTSVKHEMSKWSWIIFGDCIKSF